MLLFYCIVHNHLGNSLFQNISKISDAEFPEGDGNVPERTFAVMFAICELH